MSQDATPFELTADILQQLLNALDRAIYIKDAEGRYRFINKEALTYFNVTQTQILGHTDQELIDQKLMQRSPQTPPQADRIDHLNIDPLQPSLTAHCLDRCVETPILTASGGLQGFYGVAQAGQEQSKQLECSLKEQYTLLQALMEHTENHVFLTDEQHRIQYANRRVQQTIGLPLEKIIGEPVDTVLPEELSVPLKEQSQCALESDGSYTGINHSTFPDGNLHHYWYVKQSLQWKGQPMVMGISTDITELYQLKEQLRIQASTDALTGLTNRRYFFEQAEREFSRAKRHAHPLSMLIMDIDLFKRINDQYGHPAGDAVISTVARAIQDQVRQEDILGRVGGEEFALMLPDTALDEATLLAERIRHNVEQLSITGNWKGLITPTISLGIAVFTHEDLDLEQLYQRSDQALYQAKASGRNRVAHCDT